MVPSTLCFGANFGSALPSGPLPTTPPSMELENSTGGNLEHPDGPSSGHHVNSQVARPFSDENRQDSRSPPPTPIWEQIRLPNPMPERERLQGVQNYGTWYPRILNRLRQMSLAQVALGITRCPEILISTRESECGDTITNRFHLVDQATLGYINDQLSNEIMSATRTIMTSCELLAFLDREYGSGNPSQREALAGKLTTQLNDLSFPDDLHRLDEFITRVDAIRANLLDLGKPMSDTELGMKVVQKLPDNRFSKSDAVMNDPRWTLIRQRLRLIPLLDSTKVRSSHGHNKRPRTSASDTNTPQCSFCNRPGHRLADCRDSARAKQLLSAERSSCPPQKKVTFSGSQKPHHKVNSVSTESDNKINLIEIYSNESNLVVSDSVGSTVARSDRVNSTGDSPCLSTDIMIDSGCTTNSFCTAQFFTQYCVNSDNDRNVEIANNSKLTIAGSGSVSLLLEQPDNRPSVNMTLANAIHVPDLAGNYLSVSAAADKGLIVVFNSTNVLLYTAHDRNLVAIGQRKGNLYYFSTRPTENHQQQLNTLTLSNDASHATWHARLGHINPKNFKFLSAEARPESKLQEIIKIFSVNLVYTVKVHGLRSVVTPDQNAAPRQFLDASPQTCAVHFRQLPLEKFI